MTDRLTREDERHCKLLADIEVGLVEPYFVDVDDGFYSYEIELDNHIGCELIELHAWTESHPRIVHVRRSPSCRPKIRRELCYRNTTYP
jgi:hypothetical protein